jgi:hypothetical protein
MVDMYVGRTKISTRFHKCLSLDEGCDSTELARCYKYFVVV